MSLRFVDSFDLYSTAQIQARWNFETTQTSPVVISAGNGRNGTQCLRIPIVNSFVLKTFDFQTGWVVGFALKCSLFPGTTTALIVFYRNQTVQCELNVDSSGHLVLYKSTGTSVTGGASTNTMSTGTWYYIEVAVKPTASVGANTCYVNVDGVNWLTVAAGQNLVGNTGTTGADAIAIFGVSVINGATDIDDLYVCDDQTGVTGPFGNTMVQTIYPTADGAINDWTASTGSRSSCVDEAVANDDTDYIYYATTGAPTTINAVQLFDMQNLTYTPAAITGIQWNCYGRKSDAGYRYVKRVIRSNGTTDQNSVVNYTNSFGLDYQTFSEVLETDPCNSNAAWSRTAIDALQAGVNLYAFG